MCHIREAESIVCDLISKQHAHELIVCPLREMFGLSCLTQPNCQSATRSVDPFLFSSALRINGIVIQVMRQFLESQLLPLCAIPPRTTSSLVRILYCCWSQTINRSPILLRNSRYFVLSCVYAYVRHDLKISRNHLENTS